MFGDISIAGVIIATVVYFLIGSVWYSPLLFGKAWQEEMGFTDEDLKDTNMLKTMGSAFILSLIIALNLAFFLTEGASLQWGLIAGGLAGIGWVATSIGILYLFEQHSLRLYFINAGYHAVSYIIMGGIIGAMQA
ncbi:MAG: DUF1761 family protein [Candidatus Marinimicrobia bacterium]|nr:DUF1761 family protein [Candidatus Neomarinimicrobiota bacterium]